jgi:DNA-binding transcriptional ArsR family regulator
MSTIRKNGGRVAVQSYDNCFKVLSEPLRLRVVELLTEKEFCVRELVGQPGVVPRMGLGRDEKEFCVRELVGQLDVSQPLLSHHLQIMKKARIVHDRKAGKWVYYRLNPRVLHDLSRHINEMLARYRSSHKKETARS